MTGAAGFVGIHVVRALLERGVRVRALVFDREDDSLLAGLTVQRVVGDVTDRDQMDGLVRGVDLVIHSAGNVSFQPGDRRWQHEVNVTGTRNLVEAALENGVRRFVHVSTVNAFGYPPDGDVGDEETTYNWGPWDIGYMETKKVAQDLVLAAAGDAMETLVCNPSTMFGPDDVNMNAASYVRGLAKVVGVMGCPPGGTNVADVRAVAQGIMLSAQKGRNGEAYILGGLDLTYRDLFRYILDRLGRKAWVITIPEFAMGAAARFSEAWLGRFKGGPPLTVDMARASSKKLFYRSDKAVRELGYDPRNPLLAIDDTVAWLRAKGMLSPTGDKR